MDIRAGAFNCLKHGYTCMECPAPPQRRVSEDLIIITFLRSIYMMGPRRESPSKGRAPAEPVCQLAARRHPAGLPALSMMLYCIASAVYSSRPYMDARLMHVEEGRLSTSAYVDDTVAHCFEERRTLCRAAPIRRERSLDCW